MSLTVETAYRKIRAYFSRDGAAYALNEKAGVCQYRIKVEGKIRKCAVGCLIPLRDYKPFFDTGSTHVDEVLDAMGVRDGKTRQFLKAVQDVHDDAGLEGHPMSYFLSRLDNLYREYHAA